MEARRITTEPDGMPVTEKMPLSSVVAVSTTAPETTVTATPASGARPGVASRITPPTLPFTSVVPTFTLLWVVPPLQAAVTARHVPATSEMRSEVIVVSSSSGLQSRADVRRPSVGEGGDAMQQLLHPVG